MSEDLVSRWRTLSFAARLGFAIAFAALVATTVAAAWWALRPPQQVLFSGLSQQDASAVVKELERLKLPYRLADDGGTVLVEEDAVHKTRLKLMGGGGLALQGTVGFEMFNDADFGMTDFAQRINYQRAMQGELARTILGLAEVSQARVHLVLPEGGLFKKTQARPKASVTLGLKSPLAPEQVLSVQRLVAAAVPDLEADSVTVVDQRGQTLSRSQPAGDEQAAVGRFEAKRQAEEYVRAKVLEVMDRALGAGRAIVTVDVVLNNDRVQYTLEEVLTAPAGKGQAATGAPLRRRESMQSSGASAATRAAAAGDAALAPPAESSSHTVEVDYANGRKVEQVVLGSGHVRRLSVGVLVPAAVGETEVAKLREMVAMAVGLSDARGDALRIDTIDVSAGGAMVATAQATDEQALPTAFPEPDARPATSSPTYQMPAAAPWLVVAALLALCSAAWIVRARRPTARRDLSVAERAALLQDVRRWADEGDVQRQPEGGRP